MPAPDLVCWDFGDTRVEERFMRAAPAAVPAWDSVYDDVMAAMPGFEDDWMLGHASLNDLIGPDNKADNVIEFGAAGGHGLVFDPDQFIDATEKLLNSLLS